MFKLMLDGCDGVGKSTVAEYLAHHNNADVLHMTAHSIASIESYISRIAFPYSLVMDRCFLSEVIYSRIFNRDTEFTEDKVKDMISLSESCGYKIIILNCSLDEIMNRLNIRNNESQKLLNKISVLRKKYLEIANQFNITVINVDGKTTEEIAQEILSEMNKN